MSKIIKICISVTIIICIYPKGFLSNNLKDNNQDIIVHNDAEKLAKCHDDNVNLKIEHLERTTHIFESLIFKYLLENSNSEYRTENKGTNFELMEEIQFNLNFELRELKKSFKHLNLLSELFKKDILLTLDKSLYNQSMKLAENMTYLYGKQKSELELLVDEKLASKEVTQLSTRDYDVHLNCLKKCNSTEKLPRNCAEAITGERKVDDIYALHIANSTLKPFYAFCTFENDYEKAWTVIQRREDGSQDFNRNWEDYKNGFGDAYGEYWIGLERLHMMTKNQPHELWILLIDYDGEKRYAKYSKFSIDSEDEGYKLNVDGYKGTAGDSFTHHNNQKFATTDKDTKNCANYFESGWWFYSCYRCNLNGVFRSFSNHKMKGGIKWNYWQSTSLKYAHMAIRPV